MSAPAIPYSHWASLTPAEVAQLFTNAPFRWALAGGYAIEQFLGHAIRDHADIDVAVFRDDQLHLQGWLSDWQLFAADPPGTLRQWHPGEYLPIGIHDIWGYRAGQDAWQLQLMLLEAEGERWFSRRDRRIGGQRTDLIVDYGGFPAIRVDVQLFYKARNTRPKDEQDFQAALPLLDIRARSWLRDQLQRMHHDGHPWIAQLD